MVAPRKEKVTCCNDTLDNIPINTLKWCLALFISFTELVGFIPSEFIGKIIWSNFSNEGIMLQSSWTLIY